MSFRISPTPTSTLFPYTTLFRSDDNGLLLLDLKDLQAMLQFVSSQAKQYQTEYGNISAASIGAIQRGLVTLGNEGDRKSTRLNSSHPSISYAVFGLKKKNKPRYR